VQQTGIDPSKPSTMTSGGSESTQPYQPSQRHVAKGAGRGAAMGAVGGAIAGDAAKARPPALRWVALLEDSDDATSASSRPTTRPPTPTPQTANQRTAYNRAMAACLQGRGYTAN